MCVPVCSLWDNLCRAEVAHGIADHHLLVCEYHDLKHLDANSRGLATTNAEAGKAPASATVL